MNGLSLFYNVNERVSLEFRYLLGSSDWKDEFNQRIDTGRVDEVKYSGKTIAFQGRWFLGSTTSWNITAGLESRSMEASAKKLYYMKMVLIFLQNMIHQQ